MIEFGWDVIGDIHGQSGKLTELLERLGYQLVDNGYQHPCRKALFIGDLLDRGDGVRATVGIVRRMVEQGSAECILGNHEVNFLNWHIKDANQQPRRAHTAYHQKLMEKTLTVFNAQEQADLVEWLLDRPLWFEQDGFRAVHAVWDHAVIEALRLLAEGPSHRSLLLSDDEHIFKQIERITRGFIIPTPSNMDVIGSDGNRRRRIRGRFWDVENAQCYDQIKFPTEKIGVELGGTVLAETVLPHPQSYAITEQPLFVGHYWLKKPFELLTSNIACVDYSGIESSALVAYQWHNTDLTLDTQRFIEV